MRKRPLPSIMANMFAVSVLALGVFLLGGCSTPIDTSPSHTKVLNPDQDDSVGGSFIESSDIRTISQQLSTQLLSLPEINQSPDVVYISTEKIKNSTRYIIDTDLLLQRLRLELNKYSNGKIRFLAQDSGQIARRRILREREQNDVEDALDQAAQYIASSDIIRGANKPVRMDIKPVSNTNLFNMNADSFVALLRTKIKEHAGSQVIFARPNASPADIDYTLTGEFFAQSLTREGVANTVEDLKWAQENPEQWHNTDNSNNSTNTVMGDQINVDGTANRIKIGPNLTYKAIDPALWNSPNVRKTFNIMLVDRESMAVLEKTVVLEDKISSGQERASFILTGDISSLSKASVGERSDYVLVGLYLIDPVSNEMLWEYGYEVKRVTSRSVLYR